MSGGSRLAYIDWLRGLAVLLMIQTHAYNSWLTEPARASRVYRWSRTLGGYPAPLFLFLAGLALALLIEGRRARGDGGAALVEQGLRRGAEVFGYALAFRMWMLVSGGFSNPGGFLRVDVLNCMGLSMALVSVIALGFGSRRTRVAACVALAAGLAALAPLTWDAPWPASVPPALVGYVSGRVPGSFFPLLPWGGFTAAGAAVGIALTAARERGREGAVVGTLAVGGLLAAPIAVRLHDVLPAAYAVSDFWHTGPAFFAMRLGILLVLMGAAWVWDRGHGWSPVRQLGRTSLLVYWVHVEIVYGAVVAPGLRHQLDVRQATIALAVLCLVMLALSGARTRWSGPWRWPRLVSRPTA